MVPTTNPPAALPTEEQLAEQIRQETETNLIHHAAGTPAEIDCRLAVLDRELEAERTPIVGEGEVLAAGATAAPLCGTPGSRPAAEITAERCALKALRGDFRDLPAMTTAEDRAAIAQFEGEGGTASGHDKDDALDGHDRAAVVQALTAARL